MKCITNPILKNEFFLEKARRVGKRQNWKVAESNLFAPFGRNWNVSESESVRIGKCQNRKVSELENVRNGKCQNYLQFKDAL